MPKGARRLAGGLDEMIISLGTRRAGTRVTLLVDDLHTRVIDRDTAELIRDYQPRGLPPGPPKRARK